MFSPSKATEIASFLLRQAKRDQQQVLLLPTTFDKEEEDLMTCLSYEYRQCFSSNLKDILFGSKFGDDQRASEPGYIVEKVLSTCHSSQQRKDLMRDCLRLIRKYKAAKGSSKFSDSFVDVNAVAPFEQEFNLPENKQECSNEGPSKIDSWLFFFEKKKRKKELVNRHFSVKSFGQASREKYIKSVQKLVNQEKLLNSIKTIKSPGQSVIFEQRATTPFGNKMELKKGLPTLNKLVSLKDIVTPESSIAKRSVSEIPMGQSPFDKYYCEMKEKLKSMGKFQKRSRHLLLGDCDGGNSLLCAKLEMSDTINQLCAKPTINKEDIGKLLSNRIEALTQSLQKDLMIETRFDRKLGSFVEANLPRVAKLKKVSKKSYISQPFIQHVKNVSHKLN